MGMQISLHLICLYTSIHHIETKRTFQQLLFKNLIGGFTPLFNKYAAEYDVCNYFFPFEHTVSNQRILGHGVRWRELNQQIYYYYLMINW